MHLRMGSNERACVHDDQLVVVVREDYNTENDCTVFNRIIFRIRLSLY